MAKQDLKIRPLGGKILVFPVEQEKQTKGGLYLPETASKEKPQIGEVVAKGAGKKNSDGKVISIDIEIGSRVYFKKYSPDEVEVEGKKYLIMDEDDILAVLN